MSELDRSAGAVQAIFFWLWVALMVLEMTGGLLLAFPRTTVYGAVVIDIVMLGAVGTLIRFHEHLFAPIFLLVTISLIAYGRRHQAWRPNGRHTPTAVDTV